MKKTDRRYNDAKEKTKRDNLIYDIGARDIPIYGYVAFYIDFILLFVYNYVNKIIGKRRNKMKTKNALKFYDRKVENAKQYADKAAKFYDQAVTNVLEKHPEIEGEIKAEVDRMIKEHEKEKAIRTQKRKEKKATEGNTATN